MNNIALISQGSTYDVTGDVTNTGVSDAKGLVVTVGSPFKETGTYPEYGSAPWLLTILRVSK